MYYCSSFPVTAGKRILHTAAVGYAEGLSQWLNVSQLPERYEPTEAHFWGDSAFW